MLTEFLPSRSDLKVRGAKSEPVYLCVSQVLSIWEVGVEFMKDRVKNKLLQKWNPFFFFFKALS